MPFDPHGFYSGSRWNETPKPEPRRPVIEQRHCLMCGCRSLIQLCWYLSGGKITMFGIEHSKCDLWVCYVCKVRTRNGFWYRPDPDDLLYIELGFGDKI